LIHCAAERRPDVADADPERAERLNVGVVKNLAGLCGKNGIGMIYISTDYVFDGTAWVESFFSIFCTPPILSVWQIEVQTPDFHRISALRTSHPPNPTHSTFTERPSVQVKWPSWRLERSRETRLENLPVC
jgi:nucleoside-diphosphate-sugar epimerase